jgi:hypothetical protein
MQLEDLFTSVHQTSWEEMSSKVGDDDADFSTAFGSSDIEMTIHMA